MMMQSAVAAPKVLESRENELPIQLAITGLSPHFETNPNVTNKLQNSAGVKQSVHGVG